MNTKQKILTGAMLACTGLAAPAFAGTLDEVKERGALRCGISEGVAGFSAPNDAGIWEGLDVDMCRAVAAAVFGDDEKVEYISLNSKDRFTALQSGEVDMLPRTTTHTLTRDTSLGIDFVGVNYYDGQGIVIRADLGITDIADLDGVTICLRSGSTTELNLADYFAARGMEFSSVVFDKSDEIRKAYAANRCDVMSGDRAQLAVRRSQLEDPDAHIVLDEVISKEPLAIAVRQGDDEWDNVVRWSFNTLLLAEEHGLTQDNVAEKRESTNNPEVRRLLGVDGEFGTYLGLPQDWAYQIIAHVGNYGESFERNLGKSTSIGLSRGMNALWKDGGLQYSPPAN